MKAATDPRHLKRIKHFKKLFPLGFKNNKAKSAIIRKITAHQDKIDRMIIDSAPDWPVDKLNKVGLAIFELTVESSTPPKVVVDEAVELAKLFGTDKTPKFVNGVLGSVLKKL